MFALKDRGQYQRTTLGQPARAESGKLELFQTGVTGGRHYGIRTGFAATEIDFIIARDGMVSNPQEMEKLFFEIARNGYYLPVTNESGKVIFMPEMYDEYRKPFSEFEKFDGQGLDKDQHDELLNKILGSGYSPNKLVDFFNERFPEAYSGDVGVGEGYSLREHTLMVLNQYEKYYGDKELPGNLDHSVMRTALALHDIGKPEAIRLGSKQLQHQYTIPILEAEMNRLGFSPKEIRIASAIVDGDPIGNYIQDGNLQEAIQNITKVSNDSGIPAPDALKLLEIYYTSDAGSYTEDAGGGDSLGHLFNFDPENRKVDFSPGIKAKMLALEEAIKELYI